MTLPTGLVPIKPHSVTDGIMTAYNTAMNLVVRNFNFQPDTGSAKGNIQTMIDTSLSLGKQVLDNDELKTAEANAFKAYFTAKWELDHSLYAQHQIRENAVNLKNSITTGTGKNLWSNDEWDTFINIEYAKSRSIGLPWLDELIVEMNPQCIISEPNDFRKIPGSKYLYWAPYHTLAEARTLLNTVATNSKLASNYCNKYGVPKIEGWSVDKFLAHPAPSFSQMDFKDPRFQFWAVNGWQCKNHTTPKYLYAVKSSEATINVAADNWWTKLLYQWSNKTEPSPLWSLFQMLYPYDGTYNKLGATIVGDYNCVNLAAAPTNTYFYNAGVAQTDKAATADLAFAWLADSKYMSGAFFYVLLYNTTYTCVKDVGDSGTYSLSTDYIHGVAFQQAWDSIVENTSFYLAYRFFNQLALGASSSKGPSLPKEKKVKKEVVKEEEEEKKGDS